MVMKQPSWGTGHEAIAMGTGHEAIAMGTSHDAIAMGTSHETSKVHSAELSETDAVGQA